MKIVCVGLSKTGTTSLKKALQILGYDAIGWTERAAELYNKRNFVSLKKDYTDKFEAFTSEPWAQMFQIFDREYDCKFIYIHRNRAEWYESLKNHVIHKNSYYNLSLVYPFSDPIKEKKIMYDYFTFWHYDVASYFHNKKNLLKVELGEYGWKELCDFLDKKIPDVPFPHVNKGIEHNPDYKIGGN